MVGLDRVAADDVEDADDEEEAVYACPPSELGEWVVGRFLDLADNTTDNGDEPRKLGLQLALTLTTSSQTCQRERGGRQRDGTHKCNGRGGERKRIAQDVARLKASSPVDVGVVHFVK
jgi:hypothetical protein